MILDSIAILAASLMAIFFPSCLTDAIRNPDENEADMSKMKAGLLLLS